MNQLRACLAVALLILVSACGQDAGIVGPPATVTPSGRTDISDASHGGLAHFFFEPPIGNAFQPTGDFDPSFLPYLEVQVCEWSGSACSKTIVTFTATGQGSSRLRIATDSEQYDVEWHTRGADLQASYTYRIRVLLRDFELGHADLQVASDGREATSLESGQVFPLRGSSTIPIDFRIEKGLQGAQVIGTQGGTITSSQGTATLRIPEGALESDQLIEMTENSDLPQLFMQGGVPYASNVISLTPHGLQFSTPATVSIVATSQAPPLSDMAIYYFHPESGLATRIRSWPDSPNQAVDAQLHHFSDITLIGVVGHLVTGIVAKAVGLPGFLLDFLTNAQLVGDPTKYVWYRVDASGSNLSSQSVDREVRRAYEEWNWHLDPAVSLQRTSTNPEDILVDFLPLPPEEEAVYQICLLPSSCPGPRVRISVNSHRVWHTAENYVPNTPNLQNAVEHEFGYMFGLPDLRSNQCSSGGQAPWCSEPPVMTATGNRYGPISLNGWPGSSQCEDLVLLANQFPDEHVNWLNCATNLDRASDDPSPVPAGQPVASSQVPTVLVTDRESPPQGVPGVTVRFLPDQGGSVADTVVQTDANGVASPGSWTLGQAGTNQLTATIFGSGAKVDNYEQHVSWAVDAQSQGGGTGGGTLLLEDDFSGDLSAWTLYGSPKPRIVASAFGRTGLFDNNGDSNYNSVAVSKNTVSSASGLRIEADVYIDLQDVTGCWLEPSIGLSQNALSGGGPGGGDATDPPTGVVFSIHYEGDACWQTPSQYRRHAWVGGAVDEFDGSRERIPTGTVSADQFLNGWHTMTINVAQDGIVHFLVDGAEVWHSSKAIDPSLLAGRNVILGKRSSGSAGKAYHDFVRVFSH